MLRGGAIGNSIVKVRTIRGDEYISGAPCEQLVPPGIILVVTHGKSGQEGAVQNTFHLGGHTAPPLRIDPEKVIRPEDVLPPVFKAGLQRFTLLIAEGEIRIELHVVKIHPANVCAVCRGTFCIGVGQRVTEGIFAGMPHPHKKFHG